MKPGLTADCTGLSIDKERRLLEQTRPAFGGNIMATILTEKARPQMASVRPYVMPRPAFQPGRTGKVVSQPFTLSEEEITTKILEVIPLASEGTVDIAAADIIVSGGRGMMAPENFQLLEELAQVLGGVVAASRGAVSAGWMPHGRQVGQTGKTVKPRLYVACGISGRDPAPGGHAGLRANHRHQQGRHRADLRGRPFGNRRRRAGDRAGADRETAAEQSGNHAAAGVAVARIVAGMARFYRQRRKRR